MHKTAVKNVTHLFYNFKALAFIESACKRSAGVKCSQLFAQYEIQDNWLHTCLKCNGRFVTGSNALIDKNRNHHSYIEFQEIIGTSDYLNAGNYRNIAETIYLI